jgi:hypothetical protein
VKDETGQHVISRKTEAKPPELEPSRAENRIDIPPRRQPVTEETFEHEVPEISELHEVGETHKAGPEPREAQVIETVREIRVPFPVRETLLVQEPQSPIREFNPDVPEVITPRAEESSMQIQEQHFFIEPVREQPATVVSIKKAEHREPRPVPPAPSKTGVSPVREVTDTHVPMPAAEVVPQYTPRRPGKMPSEDRIEVNIGSVIVEVRTEPPAVPVPPPRRTAKRRPDPPSSRSKLSRYYLKGS